MNPNSQDEPQISTILEELAEKIDNSDDYKKDKKYIAKAQAKLMKLIDKEAENVLRDFVALLDRSHHDEPIGTPSAYVHERLGYFLEHRAKSNLNNGVTWKKYKPK